MCVLNLLLLLLLICVCLYVYIYVYRLLLARVAFVCASTNIFKQQLDKPKLNANKYRKCDANDN